MISLYSIHKDPEYWEDPEVFRPERFLDADGKLLYKDRLLPFGLGTFFEFLISKFSNCLIGGNFFAGRRRCLGEILARQCLFLFFIGILRQYSVVKAEDAQLPSGIPLPGITLTPERYFAKFVRRH